MASRGSRAAGFTLIELIVTLTVVAVLAGAVGLNIDRPLQGYVEAGRRADLVDAAESALARVTRELRLAAPNSVRLTGTAIEFLRTVDGGRYRAEVTAAGAGDAFDFTASSDTFDVLGGLNDASRVRAGSGGTAACLAGTIDCLLVFNTGQPGADAWQAETLAGIASVTSGANPQVGFAAPAGFRFPFRSPAQRFYIVDGPVMFRCTPSASGGELTRYSGQAITTAPVEPPAATSTALLARNVTGCSFAYNPGSATRTALVTVSLRLSEGGETVTLMSQVHLPNVP